MSNELCTRPAAYHLSFPFKLGSFDVCQDCYDRIHPVAVQFNIEPEQHWLQFGGQCDMPSRFVEGINNDCVALAGLFADGTRRIGAGVG